MSWSHETPALVLLLGCSEAAKLPCDGAEVKRRMRAVSRFTPPGRLLPPPALPGTSSGASRTLPAAPKVWTLEAPEVVPEPGKVFWKLPEVLPRGPARSWIHPAQLLARRFISRRRSGPNRPSSLRGLSSWVYPTWGWRPSLPAVSPLRGCPRAGGAPEMPADSAATQGRHRGSAPTCPGAAFSSAHRPPG